MEQSQLNRKPPRKQDHDYTLSGAYFVTICTHERDFLFGKILGEMMQLNELGQIAFGCWATASQHFEDIEIDCFVVMPNHVHAIILIYDFEPDKPERKRHASSLPTRGIFRDGRYIPPGVPSRSLGSIVGSYKSAVTKIIHQTVSDPPTILWQKNYHDRIIRNEHEFNMIRQYVLTNPARWDKDRFNSD